MPTIAGQTWLDVLAAQRARAPSPLTNEVAVAIVRGWRKVMDRWPMATAYELAAFGWDVRTGELDDDDGRRDKPYPSEAAELLEQDLEAFARRAQGVPSVTVEDTWDDARAREDLVARAAAEHMDAHFKIPLPACKTRDGATLLPRKRNGKWECDPVTVDDPLTITGRGLAVVAIVLVAYWYLERRKE